MEINYVYTKKRSEFGRHCLFTETTYPMSQDIYPNRSITANYVLQNPISRSVQCAAIVAEHEVNTVTAQYENRGMNHTEGGWPKDINIAEVEQTMRYRKKVEKDEMYIHTILQVSHSMEHCILQNNAVEIYEEYFNGPTLPAADTGVSGTVEKSTSRTVNVFRDPTGRAFPACHVSWSPNGGSRLAVAHCGLGFQRDRRTRGGAPVMLNSYIWEVENPNKPELILTPPSPLVCLEYNPKDPHCLVSGARDGRVGFWDTRRGSLPVDQSGLDVSHRDPASCVNWIASKSGSEYFSASTDGQVKWWDIRKLSEPLETLILDPGNKFTGTGAVVDTQQKISRALGASSLEYEPTIPTRFMVGTEKGYVINCNRKGKTPAEKLVSQYSAQIGPVHSLQRNPAFLKNFLTVGDWTARIWSEDVRESAIIWTGFHKVMLTAGTWSPTRFSVFYTTRVDGSLDVWDILQQQREPCLSVKVCDEPLRSLRVHEGGQLVAIGNDVGTTYLVELSENLAITHRNDKPLLTQMLERENRREKILEARMREIRLKGKTKPDVGPPLIDSQETAKASAGNTALLDQAENEFFQVVDQGLEKLDQRRVVAKQTDDDVDEVTETNKEAEPGENAPEINDDAAETGDESQDKVKREKGKQKKPKTEEGKGGGVGSKGGSKGKTGSESKGKKKKK
ncbi:dynein intermediate chain 3, ciliary [Hetaerina americana]|uniref:dynein intermediate chain 3, ciliary n=1 Tax=Hetaerina americana TaxID=62018 RepID=UPI003A7F3A4F